MPGNYTPPTGAFTMNFVSGYVPPTGEFTLNFGGAVAPGTAVVPLVVDADIFYPFIAGLDAAVVPFVVDEDQFHSAGSLLSCDAPIFQSASSFYPMDARQPGDTEFFADPDPFYVVVASHGVNVPALVGAQAFYGIDGSECAHLPLLQASTVFYPHATYATGVAPFVGNQQLFQSMLAEIRIPPPPPERPDRRRPEPVLFVDGMYTLRQGKTPRVGAVVTIGTAGNVQ